MALRKTSAVAAAGIFFITLGSTVSVRAQTSQADSSDSAAGPSVQEIVVTARKREEKLQDVPDAITALTAATLESAHVREVGDFTALIPNLNFRDGSAFQAGYFNLSMRGIGQGQAGWPSVAFIVDGVPADSSDELTSSNLTDVERIEVLRGPQSALYGAGAIAGAINVVTKRPTNELQAEGRLAYGNGQDRQADAAVSGALIPDKLFARVSASYRDFAGVIDSASNGIPLDTRARRQVQGRVIFDPVSNFEVDLRGSYVSNHNGSTYQDNLPSVDCINDFDSTYNARRRQRGQDDMTLGRIALRMQLTLDAFAVTSVTSYSKTIENTFVDICYDDPDDPLYPRQPDGGITCLSGTEAYGSAALPGQAIENMYQDRVLRKSYMEDVRVESTSGGPIGWLVGASGMRRDSLDGFYTLNLVAPDQAHQILYSDWNVLHDRWWGVYGQVSAKILDNWELTFAGRYDHQQYENTTYTDESLQTNVPVYTPDGVLVPSQQQSATAFQPKGQISYHIDPDRMAYLTVSRGFRAGYFNVGSYGVPEHTTNYEVGFKSEWLHHRISSNLALFHIDYSDQQTSSVTSEPPYRFPNTRINGAEWETSAAISSHFSLSTGLAYLNARVADGTRSPAAPLFSGSLSAQLTQPITAAWRFTGRADLTFHSHEFLQINNAEGIPDNRFLNLRGGFENDHYGIYGYGRNVTNTREATMLGAYIGTHYLRYQNLPVTYGVEVQARF
jgi:iron complex outermembrane recepter protein